MNAYECLRVERKINLSERRKVGPQRTGVRDSCAGLVLLILRSETENAGKKNARAFLRVCGRTSAGDYIAEELMWSCSEDKTPPKKTKIQDVWCFEESSLDFSDLTRNVWANAKFDPAHRTKRDKIKRLTKTHRSGTKKRKLGWTAKVLVSQTGEELRAAMNVPRTERTHLYPGAPSESPTADPSAILPESAPLTSDADVTGRDCCCPPIRPAPGDKLRERADDLRRR